MLDRRVVRWAPAVVAGVLAALSLGSAASAARQCGGPQHVTCAPGEYCHLTSSGCHTGEGVGVCEPKPQNCPGVWMPVCGCDGRTYGNTCTAAEKGANVAHEGACIRVVSPPRGVRPAHPP
jgi:hypothetical protein